MYSHNQITLQPMAFGAMKRGMASPKEAIRNAMTARSTQPGELKKVVEANKKSTVLSSGKHQYFIDSHMKKNRSPDVLRGKKKTDGDSRFKKKLALKNRKRRKTKTCTEGQLHRIKFQAEGMRQSKLKQSGVGIKSKLANFAPSGNKREGKGSRREVLKSSKVFKRKKTEETTRTLESQRGHKAPKKHFDLTIPIPNNESDEQEDTSRELAPEGVKGPYISCRNSRNASRQVSPKKNHQNQSKYRRELDKLEVNSRGSPLKRMEQTGFTLGSNYTSISSKNYKNGRLIRRVTLRLHHSSEPKTIAKKWPERILSSQKLFVPVLASSQKLVAIFPKTSEKHFPKGVAGRLWPSELCFHAVFEHLFRDFRFASIRKEKHFQKPEKRKLPRTSEESQLQFRVFPVSQKSKVFLLYFWRRRKANNFQERGE